MGNHSPQNHQLGAAELHLVTQMAVSTPLSPAPPKGRLHTRKSDPSVARGGTARGAGFKGANDWPNPSDQRAAPAGYLHVLH